MSDVQATVYAWIEQTADGAVPAVERFQIAHLNAADQLQPLASYAVEGAELGEIKSQLWQTARQVTGAWASGPQRFAIRAYFAGEDTAGAYFPFRLAPDASASDEPESTEPPNMVGILKQLMRHLEAKEKITAGMVLEMMTFQHRTLKATGGELEALRAKYHDLLTRSEEVLTHAHERELTRDIVHRSEARKDQLAEKTLAALPVLANNVSKRLGGPEVFPGAASTESLVLDSMMSSLDDQKLGHLLAAFPDPAHQTFLLGLLRKHVRKEGSGDADSDPSQH